MEPICRNFSKSAGIEHDSTKPQARLEFASRLRAHRVARGFRTARSFAKALDIDENRYTRYERAEVEPDLALIRRICTVLRARPDELLGLGSDEAAESPTPGTGVHVAAADAPETRNAPVVPGASGNAVDLAAWRLACAVAEARAAAKLRGHEAQHPPEPPHGSMATLELAAPLYRKLRHAPIEAVAEIGSDPAVLASQAALSRRVLASIDELVTALRRTGSTQPR